MTHSRPRVVVTGLGIISALGLSVAEFWDGLTAGRSGVGPITQFDASGLSCQIAGEVKGFDPKNYMDAKEARRISRCSQFALAAAKEALAQAGLSQGMPEPERAGVLLGTAVGGLEKTAEGIASLRTGGYTKVNPFIPPASLCNIPAHHLSVAYRTYGPLTTVVTACASGTQAIGEAAELIRRGSAEVVITGGVEATIQDFMIGGFCAMRALPINYNTCPEKASRPFDADREGFIYSEGCAILVLERLEHALARGAAILAEVLGHASSSDAYHVAVPDPEAAGQVRVMRWALENAGLPITAVDYINAHGTSTPVNDAGETRAIKKVFGERAYAIPISSTKSMIGHAMGAAGALEAVACIQTLQHGRLHPTINYTKPDPDCDLDYVPNTARAANVRVALSNSFGLGGQNACLVLGKYEG